MMTNQETIINSVIILTNVIPYITYDDCISLIYTCKYTIKHFSSSYLRVKVIDKHLFIRFIIDNKSEKYLVKPPMTIEEAFEKTKLSNDYCIDDVNYINIEPNCKKNFYITSDSIEENITLHLALYRKE